jgi:hypothetical protein
VRLAIFRAIKEDMRQIITQMVRVHGDGVLRHKVTSTDLAHSAKLRCVFEGMDDIPADGLTPRQFTLALIERGYGRASVLRMLPTEDDSTDSENSHVPLPARAEGPDLEEHCASLVGTQVTLPEHGDCRVVSVCAGGHIKVVLQPSGRSTFVPMSAFAADAAVNEPRSIDLSVMQPIQLPSSTVSARSIAQAEIGEWFADQRSVTWEFQAGTLWSKFDAQTNETLEASVNSCTPESSLGGSLMSLRAMRTENANALHLVNDLSTFMQVPLHDNDHFVEALPSGCRVVCADDEEQVVAAELSSVLAARGWCVEVCASGSSPRKGDICLELESSRDWPLRDARFGASAYALAIENDAPLRIRARTPDGLRRGCAMLARSIGPGLHHQHAGVRMQRSICHGGALAELVSPLAPSVAAQQGVPEQGGMSSEEACAAMPQLTARLPPCFYMDCPIHTGYNRIWYGRTECWTLATFLDMAAVAGAFQPSHSRRVRRRINYSRSDYKMLQLCSPVTGISETYKYATAIESDGEAVKVQLAGQPDTLEVPINRLQVPATIATTKLDWSTVTFAQRSTSGKVGVLFLQFPDSRAIVAKLTDSPASELAGSELARMLGIRTPNIGVLSTAHGEGAKVVATLRRLRSEGRFEGKWESPRKFAFVLLQELQSGRTLKELCHEEAAAIPDSTWAIETFGPAGNPSQRGMASVRALGALVACDVLSHNSDRFFLPGLFKNFSRCGNVANLMFDSCGDNPQPIAIDNAFGAYDCTRADNALRFQQYCDSVSELTGRVISRLRDVDNGRTPQLRAHPALKGVCEFFISGQGKSGDASYVPGLEHDFGQLGLTELERGFLSVVEHVRRWKSANGIEDVFASLRNLTRQALGVPEQSVAFDLQRLEPSFFVAIANAMVTAQPAATSAQNYSTLLPHDEAAEPAMTALPPDAWYIKRPALGVGKPFCKTGDRLAAQLETVGSGTTTQWRIGVVRGYDQLSDRATVQFALPHGDKEVQGRDVCCCGAGAGGAGVQLPQLTSIGLDDLPSVRWALRTACDILHEEPEFDASTADYASATGVVEPQTGSDAWQQPSLPPPPVLTPPPAVELHPVDGAVARVVDAGSCKDVVVPAGRDNEAYTSDRAMPWDRFARATARLEGNLANAIAVSGRV